MRTRIVWALVGLGLLPGCFSSGFTRPDATARAHRDPILVTDGAIADAQVLKPQLRLPCRIAVYLKPTHDGRWRWSPKDVARVEEWSEALKNDGIASDVFLLPDMLCHGEKADVKDLRLAAARCGADALLVVQGSADVQSYNNVAAVFNLTIVGGYLVPASHRDALFTVEGVLFDTNNGFVYAGAKAEGEGRVVRPTFIVEEKVAVARAQARAMEDFGSQLLQRLRNLTAR